MTVTQAAPEPVSLNSIKLLAKFDGESSADQPVDYSFFGNTPVLAGTSAIQSSEQWFGCPSAADTGSAGTVVFPITSIDFGATGDFAIEFYCYTDVSHATDTIIQVGASPNQAFRLRWNSLGDGALDVSTDGTSYSTTTFTLNNSASANWFFFHLERSGGAWSL